MTPHVVFSFQPNILKKSRLTLKIIIPWERKNRRTLSDWSECR